MTSRTMTSRIVERSHVARGSRLPRRSPSLYLDHSNSLTHLLTRTLQHFHLQTAQCRQYVIMRIKCRHYTTNLCAVFFCIYAKMDHRPIKTTREKSHCKTRWESKVTGDRAIRYQIGGIYDALTNVTERAKDAKYRTEAQSLA